jgi:radical SAM protein with 4Fe4S-binding SPASM domain
VIKRGRSLTKSNYCVLPFKSVSIGNTGNIRPCCNTHAYYVDNQIHDTPYDEIINNKPIIKLRKQFLKNERSSDCSRCWMMEDNQQESFRTVANRNKFYGLDTGAPMSKRITIEDIQYLNIELGNVCNLACRMCNPTSSSLIAKQQNELKLYHGDVNVAPSRESKDKILRLFKEAINLNEVYLVGGEPLYNDFHDEILEVLVEHPNRHNMCIHYSTNLIGTKFDKYLDKWKQFKLIDMQVSLDGESDVYEYIRWPGKWDKLVSNIKRIIDIHNFKVGVSITVQCLNAANIPTLVEELNKIGSIPPFFIPISGENVLSMVPNKVLRQAIEDIKKVNFEHEHTRDNLIRMYEKAITTVPDRNDVVEFFKKQKGYDSLRNDNLFKVLPYMEQVADKWDIEKW